MQRVVILDVRSFDSIQKEVAIAQEHLSRLQGMLSDLAMHVNVPTTDDPMAETRVMPMSTMPTSTMVDKDGPYR